MLPNTIHSEIILHTDQQTETVMWWCALCYVQCDILCQLRATCGLIKGFVLPSLGCLCGILYTDNMSFYFDSTWKLYLFLEHQYQPVSSFLLNALILFYQNL